jgi:hypothetical protein
MLNTEENRAELKSIKAFIDRFFSNLDIVFYVFAITAIIGYSLGYKEGINYEPLVECTSEYVAIAGDEACQSIQEQSNREYEENMGGQWR